MRKRRLILNEESCDEMEAVTLNQASAAKEEVQWTWKREALQATKLKPNLYSRRAIVEQIANELELIGDEVYKAFRNSCFGFLMRFDTQGVSCNTALHYLFAHEVIKADASSDELWYRVGGRFIRFSKYEYALVTGLSFGPTTFDPSAEHDPPASGLFLRNYRGQRLTMDTLRSDFINGVFRQSPPDALKVAKLLIVYFLLFGMDGRRTYIDQWAWTLIEDTDRWETFMWGKYTYQILLRCLMRVPTELPHSYRVYGYVWAFLIWAFEAIPELGNTCGVLTFDDVLPRCLRWRFIKTQVDMSRFYDRQMEVHSTLEPSAEEQRQAYWEHIHDDLRSGVCYIHKNNPFKKKKTSANPFKKKKTSANPSALDVLPVSRPQGSRATPTRRFRSTSAAPIIDKRKRTDPLTTRADQEKAPDLSDHGGHRDEITSAIQKELPRVVRGELPALVRQELPSVIRQEVYLALKKFFSLRDSPSPLQTPDDLHTTTPAAKDPTVGVQCDEAEVGAPIVPREFEKYKCVDTMAVKMGKEIEDLRHEKLAAIKTVEELRLKQLEADKVVEELKRKNLEANQSVDELKLKKMESDKAVELYKSRLENLSPKIMKIAEDFVDMLTVEVGDLDNLVNDVHELATSEEGENLDIPDFKGGKDNSGNDSTPDDAVNVVVMSPGVRSTSNSTGSRSSGLSKKGDRNSAQPWTREDDAHTVKTSLGSHSHYNPPQVEHNDTVKVNEHREPRASGAHASGTQSRRCGEEVGPACDSQTPPLGKFNGLKDEVSTDSDESCTDSRMDDLIASLRSEKLGRNFMYEADMLRAFQQDEELCMNAVCALYRQQVDARKSKGRSNLSKNGGFSPVDSISGCALAEYLIDDDKELRLRKSVSEVKKQRPDVIGQCRKLANIYVEKLFAIYCAAKDPFFGH